MIPSAAHMSFVEQPCDMHLSITPLRPSQIERDGLRSECATHLAIQPLPARLAFSNPATSAAVKAYRLPLAPCTTSQSTFPRRTGC